MASAFTSAELIQKSTSTLARVIRDLTNEDALAGEKVAFPAFDGSKIRGILDETMGYS